MKGQIHSKGVRRTSEIPVDGESDMTPIYTAQTKSSTGTTVLNGILTWDYQDTS